MPQSQSRYYFRAPAFDINPESAISTRLGSIITRLGKLTNPLNQYDALPISPNSISKSCVPDFQEVVRSGISGSAGLNGTLSQTLTGAVLGEIMYTFAKDKTVTYNCTSLETYEFEPSEQYVADSITASLRVQNFIADSFAGRKKVYMITGLKIAEAFSMSTVDAGSRGPVCRVGLCAPAVGISGPAIPEIGLHQTGGREVSHGPSASKVIFAYRTIEIWPKSDGTLRYKDISGGQYGYGEDEEEDEEEVWLIEPVEEKQILGAFPGALPVLMDIQSAVFVPN